MSFRVVRGKILFLTFIPEVRTTNSCFLIRIIPLYDMQAIFVSDLVNEQEAEVLA